MGELARLQKAFTEYLRDPEQVQMPKGLDERRMKVYSELIFNNVSALLSDFFPVIKSILSDETWDQMVRNFFISHQSQTPYFMELSGEFVEYVQQGQLRSGLPDYLTELAHYEWVELALFTLDEELPPPIPDADLGQQKIGLSQLALPLAYTWPVHRISPEFQPEAPDDEPTLLLVCRIPDESIRFFELQPLSYQLLYDMQQGEGLVPVEWLEARAGKLGLKEPDSKLDSKKERDTFIHNGLALLQSFNQHRIFTQEKKT